MRSIADHLDAVLELALPKATRVSLADVLAGAPTGALATPAHARLEVPPFANSAMDGFAVHAADLKGAGTAGAGPWTFPVAGDIPAGAPAIVCPSGHAVRVMTGAPVPPGEDIMVVPVEQTDIAPGPAELPDSVTIASADPARSHIRAAGSDVQVGQVVAPAGTVVDAATLAALVAAGVREIDVFQAPKVAVISTGDELVAWPGEVSGAQIPNSNLPMLAGICRQAGAGAVTQLHAADTTDAFAHLLSNAAANHDIVVTAGGVSAGAFDVVRAATQDTTGMWFGHVEQRPGGPQGLGTFQGTPLLCLPGNPVAAFVSAHLYLVPLVRAAGGQMRGLRLAERPRILAQTESDTFPRPHATKTLVIPVRLDFSHPTPSATSLFRAPGSHRVGSLSGADGLAILPPAEQQSAGKLVEVIPTRWT